MVNSIKTYKCDVPIFLILLFFVFLLINIVISVRRKIEKRYNNKNYSYTPSTKKSIQPVKPVQLESDLSAKAPDQECRDDKGKITIAKKFNVIWNDNHKYANYQCPPVCNDESYFICDPGTNNMCCKKKNGIVENKVSECNFGEKSVFFKYNKGENNTCNYDIHTTCDKRIIY